MQIVRGGKVSRLHYLLVIRRTFAIVQQFETFLIKKKIFAGKPSRLEANPRKLSAANDLNYTVIMATYLLRYSYVCWLPLATDTHKKF